MIMGKMIGKLFGIFRIAKRQAAAIGGIEAENNRTEDDRDKKDFKRSDIDFDKTHLNDKIVFSPDIQKSISDELQKHGISKPRSNAVVALDALYTASPEFFEKNSKVVADEYFKKCIDFHEKHFGHIVNAVIHYDEKTPHMHVISVPIVDRGEKGYALCAKDLLNGKTLLSRLQTEFHKEVSSDFNLDRGEIREDGARKEHLDSLDFKRHQREIEIAQRESQIEKQQEIIEAKKAEINEAEVIKAKLETEIGKLDAIREAVKPLPFSVSQLFHNIGDALKIATNNLFTKIEKMEMIFVSDLRAAFCKMVDIGKHFFTPATITGDALYRFGHKPLYDKDVDGQYKPTAIEDFDGNIVTDIDRDDWRETFPRYERPDYNPAEQQKQDIIDRIITIRDIACGKPQEKDNLREEDDIEVAFVDGEFVPVDQLDKRCTQDCDDYIDQEMPVSQRIKQYDTDNFEYENDDPDDFSDTDLPEADFDTDPFEIDGNDDYDDEDNDYTEDIGFD